LLSVQSPYRFLQQCFIISLFFTAKQNTFNMVRRKNKAQMPNLDAESADKKEKTPSTTPITLRVSKRTSNSVHRTKIAKKEEMPVLEKVATPTKPDVKSGRRSAKEPAPPAEEPPVSAEKTDTVVPEPEAVPPVDEKITGKPKTYRRRSAKVVVTPPLPRSGRRSTVRQSTSAAEAVPEKSVEVLKSVEAEKETAPSTPDSGKQPVEEQPTPPAPETTAEPPPTPEKEAEPETLETIEKVTTPSTVAKEKTPSPKKPPVPASPVKAAITKKRKSVVEEKPIPLLDSTIAGRAGKRQKKEKKIFDPSTEPTKKKVKHVDGEKEFLLKSPSKLTPSTSLLEPSQKSPQRSIPSSPSQKKAPTPTTSKKPRLSDTLKQVSSAIKQKYSLFCYICLGSKGNLEQTVCSCCGSSAHNKCLEDQQYISSVKILGQNWVCQNCLSCCVCHKNSLLGQKSEKEVFVCNSCKKTYHAKCHRPSLVNKPIVKISWKCHTCSELYRTNRLLIRSDDFGNGDIPSPDLTEFIGFSEVDIKNEMVKSASATPAPIVKKKSKPSVAPAVASSSSSSSTSRTYSTTTSDSSSDRQIPTNVALESPTTINRLQNWSVDDVYDYFLKFFPEYAKMFRDQEIDGAVLLLMRRSDVLKGFKHIKLGPAINIYRHIVMLQTKNTDPRQTWY
jgi:zinc finger protein ubi-d4